MAVHRAEIQITRAEYDRVNRLLAIESLEEMTDQELLDAGANTSQCEGVYIAKFDDGSMLNFDLCSGLSNYYDDVVWTSPDGRKDVVLDCEYELGDVEFQVDGETYIVTVMKR